MSNEENIKSDNKSGDSSDLPTIPALDIGAEECDLLAELKNLTLKRPFDVKKLSPKVTKRVLFLKDIQVLSNFRSFTTKVERLDVRFMYTCRVNF
jgi:nucleosome assembly protein 1-like 1